MATLPGEDAPIETTVGKVSAMTLIIPIRQDLVPPLIVAENPSGPPTLSLGDGPPVRPVENLTAALGAVKLLVASGTPMGLNEVGTIHFARWVIIDEGRNLLFTANFDTSLDQYLTDFMVIANTKAAPYMDLVWGNCVGYPGAEPIAFINWARSWLIDTTLFFPTISDLTVKDVYWLRQFRNLFVDFDKVAQTVARESWPPDLRAAYEKLKRDTNLIDLSVIT